jgi:hypothetical protein
LLIRHLVDSSGDLVFCHRLTSDSDLPSREPSEL